MTVFWKLIQVFLFFLWKTFFFLIEISFVKTVSYRQKYIYLYNFLFICIWGFVHM